MDLLLDSSVKMYRLSGSALMFRGMTNVDLLLCFGFTRLGLRMPDVLSVGGVGSTGVNLAWGRKVVAV